MLIAIESLDDKVRRIQMQLLTERLKAAGYEVQNYSFPQLDRKSSYFAQKYLDGEYGPEDEISPYTASLFYSLDRYEAAPLIRQDIADGKIVIVSGYAGANMAKQGVKFTNAAEQRGFFMWNDSLEYQLLGIPRPNIHALLNTPTSSAATSVYGNIYRLFPKDFKLIEATKNSQSLKVTEINNKIWAVVKPLLPRPTHRGQGRVVSLDESINGQLQRNEASKRSLKLNDISLLAANKLLEAEGINLRYRAKWPPQKNRISYYIPAALNGQMAKEYRQTMEKLGRLYKEMSTQVADKKQMGLIEGVVPLAALGDASFYINKNSKAIEAVVAESKLPEVQRLFRNKISFKERPSEPESLNKLVKQLADTKLPPSLKDSDETIKLIDVWPRNEFELLKSYLYRRSDLEPAQLSEKLDKLSYDQKAEALKLAAKRDYGDLLKNAWYSFEVICDYSSIIQLSKTVSLKSINPQSPTPRYGYDVDEKLEEIGISEQFIECFDLSLELFSKMQAEGYETFAGYATLAGHKARWQISMTADAICQPAEKIGAKGKELLKSIKSKVSEVHPLISQTSSSTSPVAKHKLQNTSRK